MRNDTPHIPLSDTYLALRDEEQRAILERERLMVAYRDAEGTERKSLYDAFLRAQERESQLHRQRSAMLDREERKREEWDRYPLAHSNRVTRHERSR